MLLSGQVYNFQMVDWFSKRFLGPEEQPELYEAVAPPGSVLAQFFGRGESEVVVDSRLLENVKRLWPSECL